MPFNEALPLSYDNSPFSRTVPDTRRFTLAELGVETLKSWCLALKRADGERKFECALGCGVKWVQVNATRVYRHVACIPGAGVVECAAALTADKDFARTQTATPKKKHKPFAEAPGTSRQTTIQQPRSAFTAAVGLLPTNLQQDLDTTAGGLDDADIARLQEQTFDEVLERGQAGERDEYPEYPQNTDTSGGDTESDEEGEAALLARLKIPKGRETDGITPPKDAPEENFFATGAAEEMA